MKRLAVCAEIHSANLGDQAIHACLLYLLRRADTGVETISLDLSGREGGVAPGAGRGGLKRMAAAWQSRPLLKWVYRLANATYLRRRMQGFYAGEWGRRLDSASALVIGGGQLLMDDGLNFPVKVSGAAREAARRGIPLHFSACGVGKSWSPLGADLFREALAGSATLSVRDRLSAQRLRQLMPVIQAEVTFDPAIWAAEVYAVQPIQSAPGTIGLGVMSSDAFHARANTQYSRQTWMQLWLELVRALLGASERVLLFTTGSPADERFAGELYAQAAQDGSPRVDRAPTPADVPALLRTLNACQVVVAARLHAAILANACGIASLGLNWDEKVRAYYEETGRGDLCFALQPGQVGEISRAAGALNGQPFPAVALEELRERAFESARLILR